jgi:hypothetical protein
MEFVQRLQGRLFTDPPLGGLDELEDPDRPALVPATQSEPERRSGLSLTVAGVE